MSPLIEMTAVGGLVKAEDSDRYRPVVRGEQVSVTEEDAQRYVSQGVARLVDDRVAEHAEEEAPQPGAIPVSDLDLEEGGTPVATLKKFAHERRIDLQGASRRADIVTAIQAWQADGGDGESGDPESEET